MIKINATNRLKATQQAPSIPGKGTSLTDTSGEALMASDDAIIAPSSSYKEKNERDLDRQQNTRETEQHKESTSPTSDMNKTEVKDMSAASVRAVARLSMTRKNKV